MKRRLRWSRRDVVRFARFYCAAVVILFSLVRTGLAAKVVAIHDVAVVERRGQGEVRALVVYLAGPGKQPHVAGTIQTHNQRYAMHHLVAHGSYVLALFWTELEIYDLSDPAKPRLARLLHLKPNHASWGGGGIVIDGDVATILVTTVSAELVMKGQPDEWQVRPIPPTPKLEGQTEGLYDEKSRLANPDDVCATGGPPRTVYLPGGVFAVDCTSKRIGPGLIRHRQYLRLVGSKARVLIGTWDETID